MSNATIVLSLVLSAAPIWAKTIGPYPLPARCDSQDIATQSLIAQGRFDDAYKAYEKGDLAAAESAWLEVSKCASQVPSWPKAIYNLGLLKERHGDLAQAIARFHMVLDSHPNDREPGGDLLEVYRNYSYFSALQISNCYSSMGNYRQALDYARLAKYSYRYQTWCGTCRTEAEQSLNLRIAYLTARVDGPYVLTCVFIGGFVFVRRFSRKGRRSDL
jgi:tetratricopeptide (TPR) repeat protein